jgi:myxalamid-type polyketide synthase MxaB
VSSFGFGGTNVHMVLQEADYSIEKQNERLNSTADDCYILPLSADSYMGLRSLANVFREILASEFSVTAKDVCYAASQRRSQFDHRYAVVGHSRKELLDNLTVFLSENQDVDISRNETRDHEAKLVFVFPRPGWTMGGHGQGPAKTGACFF